MPSVPREPAAAGWNHHTGISLSSIAHGLLLHDDASVGIPSLDRVAAMEPFMFGCNSFDKETEIERDDHKASRRESCQRNGQQVGFDLQSRQSTPSHIRHTLGKDAKVTHDGKECKLADLKAGSPIHVTTSKDDDLTATKIESGKRVAAPTK